MIGNIGFGLDPMTNPANPPLDGKNYTWSNGRWVEVGAAAPAPSGVPGIAFGKAAILAAAPAPSGAYDACQALKDKIARHRASGSSATLIRALEGQLATACAVVALPREVYASPPAPAAPVEVIPIQTPPPIMTPPMYEPPLNYTRAQAEGEGPPLAMIAAGVVGIGVAGFMAWQILSKKRRAA